MLQRPPNDRRKRHKQRVAAGRCCVTIELDARVVSWLVRHRHLWPPKEAYERDEIAAGITEMLRASSRDD
jgi:hypothetical protein